MKEQAIKNGHATWEKSYNTAKPEKKPIVKFRWVDLDAMVRNVIDVTKSEDSEDSEDIPLSSDIPEFLPEAVSRVESALENLNTHKKVIGETNGLFTSESPTPSDPIIPDSLSSGEAEDSEDLSLPAEIPEFFPEAVSRVESALENLITDELAPEDSIRSSDIHQ